MTTPTSNKIPTFASYEEEAEFWDTHSFIDFRGETKHVKVHFAADAFKQTPPKMSTAQADTKRK